MNKWFVYYGVYQVPLQSFIECASFHVIYSSRWKFVASRGTLIDNMVVIITGENCLSKEPEILYFILIVEPDPSFILALCADIFTSKEQCSSFSTLPK